MIYMVNMMSLGIVLAIAIVNILAILIVYKFLKKLPKKEILVFLAVSVAIIYILISIVYWFSGFGIEENIHEKSKKYVIYVFVPVNIILFVPFIAAKYNKLKSKDIKLEKFIKNVMITFIIMIIVLVVEFFYFKKIQQNIDKISFENTVINSNGDSLIIEDEELANEIIKELIQEKTKNNENI